MSVYRQMAILDLRHITVEAAKQIEKITQVAMLILPKDGSAELLEAIAAIPTEEVAYTISLLQDEELTAVNGTIQIDDSFFKPDGKTFLLCNGVCVVGDLSPETKGKLFINGILLGKKNVSQNMAGLTIEALNGVKLFLDYEEYKVFPNQLDLDAAAVRYLSPKTALVAGNQILIANDVTAEMLEEKQVMLICGNQITCHQELAPYIRMKAFVGNCVTVQE